MNADRTVLTDGMWARTGDMLPGMKPDPGGTAADSRLLVEAVIPPERNRTAPRARDQEMYGWRRLVDSFLPRTREFRAIATRYDRTAAGFAAGIHLVAGVVAAS